MDLTAPSLTLTNPLPGQVYKGIIQLQATSADNTAIDRLEFLIDGVLAATEKSLPYSATFDTASLLDGPHKISVVSYDSSGNKAQTADAIFTTSNVDPFWTVFTASADAHKIYVSASVGVDTNDGLTEQSPVKTLAVGYANLVSGRPDWLLLKRGDVFHEAFPSWTKSGRGVSEPLLISAYGAGSVRPVVSSQSNVLVSRTAVNYVAVTGLHLTNLDRDPGSPTFNKDLKSDCAIRWMSTGQYLLIEDCLIDFHGNGIVSEVSKFHDLRIRRSVITNNWYPYTLGHSQGIYVDDVVGFLLEENIIDANGFLDNMPGATPTMFNHNVYQQIHTSGAVIRGNIFSRGSATGIQMRNGGLCDSNFFVQNPTSMTLGLVSGGESPVPGGVMGEIKNNFFLEGKDMTANPVDARGAGLVLGNTKDVSVHDNIFSQCFTAKHYHGAIEFDCSNGDGLQKLSIQNNLIWKWNLPQAIAFTGACGSKAVMANNVISGTFPRPDQMLKDYDADFFNQARKQSRLTWNPKYTAAECLKFFRVGFGK